jgi:RNA polymerase sigma-70 factor (ECF subfamily)
MTAEPHELDLLAQRACAGDRDAFRDLVLATQHALALSIAANVISRDMMEEVLQETYVTAFEKLGQYRQQGALLAWLKAIARNRLFQLWRERKRAAAVQHDDLAGLVADQGLSTAGGDPDGAAEEARAQELRRLAQCLEKLPARARMLLERRYRDGHPLSLLARQFKRTVEVLSVTLFRLRQQVRACIEHSEGG